MASLSQLQFVIFCGCGCPPCWLKQPLLESRSIVLLLLLLCNAQANPPGFLNGVEWRSLVGYYIPKNSPYTLGCCVIKIKIKNPQAVYGSLITTEQMLLTVLVIVFTNFQEIGLKESAFFHSKRCCENPNMKKYLKHLNKRSD